MPTDGHIADDFRLLRFATATAGTSMSGYSFLQASIVFRLHVDAALRPLDANLSPNTIKMAIIMPFSLET